MVLSKHDKAELGSGIFYIVIYAGALYHVLVEQDYIPAIIMTIGTIGGAYYGYMHIKSKRNKMEGTKDV